MRNSFWLLTISLLIHFDVTYTLSLFTFFMKIIVSLVTLVLWLQVTTLLVVLKSLSALDHDKHNNLTYLFRAFTPHTSQI